ncbi:MAG: hypothetical protein Kow0092_26760 [Deferrisomatales bacterium]
MRWHVGFGLLAWAIALTPVWGAEPSQADRAVEDYETRLEALAKELEAIRTELGQLVDELVAEGAGTALLFLETPPPQWRETGVRVRVDGRTVFARAFTAAERDVLDRGLPLEVAELHLAAGDHRVEVAPLDGDAQAAAVLPLERAGLASWVARGGETGVVWRAE